VGVEYVDVLSAGMAQHPSALRVVNMGSYPLPLVSVNGKLQFAGRIPLEAIVAELQHLGVGPARE
jgi:hypothetical protein